MKQFLLTISFIFLSFLIWSQEDIKKPHISFEELTYDFGDVIKGAETIHDFNFKNTGKVNLELVKVKAPCGCTTPTYSKEPIKKRKSGSISVKYNSNNIGKFKKSVTVNSNADNAKVVLIIKGNVIAADKAE